MIFFRLFLSPTLTIFCSHVAYCFQRKKAPYAVRGYGALVGTPTEVEEVVIPEKMKENE